MSRTQIDVADSPCYDFLCSAMRLYNNAELTPPKKPNPEIREWIDKYSGAVPADIRALSEDFFSAETYFGLSLVGLCKLSGAQTVTSFLSYLGSVSAQELLARLLYSGVGPGEEVTADLVARLQDNQAAAVRFVQEEVSFSPQEKWRMLGFLLNPDQTKANLLRLLEWHYLNIYCHDEERVLSFLKRENQNLRERLRFDQEYLRLLIPYDRKRPPKALTIALSYYYEAASLYNVMDAVYLFGYRYSEGVESRHSVFTAAQVFKTLADETRLQILKLLLQRPWYGHELAQQLSISNSTVSHHISMLAFSGLVKAYKKENRVYYELDAGEAKKVVMENLDRILLD